MASGEDTTRGIDRRTLLKRGAAAGGVLWSVPVIDSFLSPAGATFNSPTDLSGCAVSYLAFILNCGGTEIRVKFQGDNPFPQNVVCGTFSAPDCDGISPPFPSSPTTGSCPAGLDATFDPVTETITIQVPPGCSIVGNQGWLHSGSIKPDRCAVVTGTANGQNVTFPVGQTCP